MWEYPFPLDSAVIEDFSRVAPRRITCSALALGLFLYFRLVEFARRSSGSVDPFHKIAAGSDGGMLEVQARSGFPSDSDK